MRTYENFWKEIVENSDGSLNKEQIKKELEDFSVLINNLSKIYCQLTDSMVSYPNVSPDTIIALHHEQIQEAYERGYQDALEDLGDHK